MGLDSHHKPHRMSIFSKFRRKRFIYLLLIIAALYLLHQLVFMFLLDSSESRYAENVKLNVSRTGIHIRGVRHEDLSKYDPDENGMFTCFAEGTKIPMSFVNDDYCDCPSDGSDEPGTAACNNGHFYCASELRLGTEMFIQSIPSMKVNDGICDCCDGSDEWGGIVLIDTLPKEIQTRLNRYQAPCPNTCRR